MKWRFHIPRGLAMNSTTQMRRNHSHNHSQGIFFTGPHHLSHMYKKCLHNWKLRNFCLWHIDCLTIRTSIGILRSNGLNGRLSNSFQVAKQLISLKDIPGLSKAKTQRTQQTRKRKPAKGDNANTGLANYLQPKLDGVATLLSDPPSDDPIFVNKIIPFAKPHFRYMKRPWLIQPKSELSQHQAWLS